MGGSRQVARIPRVGRLDSDAYALRGLVLADLLISCMRHDAFHLVYRQLGVEAFDEVVHSVRDSDGVAAGGEVCKSVCASILYVCVWFFWMTPVGRHEAVISKESFRMPLQRYEPCLPRSS